MMLPEEDYKRKWCAFANIVGVNGNRHNTGDAKGKPVEGALCIGSVCAHWRWGIRGEKGSPDKGYCGLAGESLLDVPTEREYRENRKQKKQTLLTETQSNIDKK